MRASSIFTLIPLAIISFRPMSGQAQENQDSSLEKAGTREFVLPPPDDFMHNKIPTTNAVNPEPAIFSMVNISASQLVTASVNLDEQSLTFAPLHLNAGKPRIFDMALKFGLRDNISHLGTGFKWRAGNKRLTRIYDKNVQKYKERYENILKITNDKVKEVETKNFYANYRTGFIEDVYSEFNRSHLTLHGSFSALLFEVLGGDDVDANGDGLIDNFFRVKGFNLSGGGAYSFSQKVGIHVNYNYSERRASAVEDAVSVVYNGFSATVSRLFIINKKYVKSDDYLKHSFIPGLEVALAFEYEDVFKNEDFAEDGIISQSSIAPVFDLKISPLSQFRVSLPFKIMELSDNSIERRLTAIVQYNLQISEF